MPSTPLDRIRTSCLALPDAHEVEAWGAPTFRVRNKLFAMVSSPANQHGAGRWAVWLHCAPDNQRALIDLDPSRYFCPPYVGKSGWVGVWIDQRPRWREIEPLIRDAYRRVAPKRLAATVE
jgi:predicted DNA-binding protein (MmcQ/YjbR family)